MEKNLRFNSTLTNIEKVNPLFSRATSRVLYTGINRNNSYITKEVVEKALFSIKNVPVVGEYLKQKDNFGGHGGKLEISDNGIEWINTTIPFGVVSSDAEIYWENVTESDGTVNEYLVVDGIYLWTGRYNELNVMLEQGKMNQSMEIEVVNGGFAVVNGQETFKIDDFVFSALCILGVDKGNSPEDHIEPCFESSDIKISYNLDKDEFTKQYNQMLAELKFSLQKEGGNQVEDVKQEFEETVAETTESEVVETEDTVEEVVDVVEETATESEENFEQTESETQVEETAVQEEFEQVEETVVVEEEVKEEFETESEVVEDVVEEQVETFTKEFVEGLNAQIESLTTKLNELKTYKRQREESDLASKFTDKLSVDEINEVFETSKEFSLEEVEEKLLAKFGKKNFSLTEDKVSNKVKITVKEELSIQDEPYNGLFSKFLNKQ